MSASRGDQGSGRRQRSRSFAERHLDLGGRVAVPRGGRIVPARCRLLLVLHSGRLSPGRAVGCIDCGAAPGTGVARLLPGGEMKPLTLMLRQRLAAVLNAMRAASHRAAGTVPKAPLMIYLEVTRRCNLRCRHCDIWMTEGKEGSALRPEMTADRIRSVLSELVPHGLLAVDLFGGEPLLRPELPGLVRDLREAGLHVTVTTNGTLLSDRVCEVLVEAGLSQLLVSLDGPGPAVHDRLRGR
ncbi:MAG: radical SAM protein, partial [Deltaproteobacteria bacterium]|nr:radical SAM protein [Deltaproteobacteria bacterium]